MKSKRLSRRNVNLLDKFIEKVESKSFALRQRAQTIDTLPLSLNDSSNMCYNERDEELFFKYKLCLHQPFYIKEFHGNAKKRKEWAVIKFIPSTELQELTTVPLKEATLIRTLDLDYKLIFDDQSYYTSTGNGNRKKFHFQQDQEKQSAYAKMNPQLSEGFLLDPEPKHWASSVSLNSSSFDQPVTVRIHSAPFSINSSDSFKERKMILDGLRSLSAGSGVEDSELHLSKSRTVESVESICFITTN